MKEEYEWVADGLDTLLAQYGYVRDGHLYRTEQGNNDTLVFFAISVSPVSCWDI